MCSEDRAVCKELRDAGHPLRKMGTHRWPAQPVHEEIQHEFFPHGIMPQGDRRTNGIGNTLLGAQRDALVAAEIAERIFAEMTDVFSRRIPDGKSLRELRPRNGQSAGGAVRQIDAICPCDRVRLLQIKGDVTVVDHKVHIVTRVLVYGAHRGEKSLVYVDPCPEGGVPAVHKGDLFAEEDVAAGAQRIIFDVSRAARNRSCLRRVRSVSVPHPDRSVESADESARSDMSRGYDPAS